MVPRPISTPAPAPNTSKASVDYSKLVKPLLALLAIAAIVIACVIAYNTVSSHEDKANVISDNAKTAKEGKFSQQPVKNQVLETEIGTFFTGEKSDFPIVTENSNNVGTAVLYTENWNDRGKFQLVIKVASIFDLNGKTIEIKLPNGEYATVAKMNINTEKTLLTAQVTGFGIAKITKSSNTERSFEYENLKFGKTGNLILSKSPLENPDDSYITFTGTFKK